MNADWSSIAARARVHAALSDPARLSIVDMLRLGDLSPGEIATRLDMPTNLVAHHVGILKREGLITRARSEGDRRRTYLRLTGAVPAEPRGMPAVVAERVVFVCTRNSARSPLAAAIWAGRSRIPVTSAGTSPASAVHEATVAAAERHRLSLGHLRTKQLTQVVRHGDLLVAVCDSAYEKLPSTLLDRLHWSVPDPVPAATDTAFDAAISDLATRISHLAPAVTFDRRKI